MDSGATQAGTAQQAGYDVGARQRAATLAVVFVLYMLNSMDRNVLAAVAEYMKRDLSLSDAQTGAIQTVCLVCVAGFALPAAFTIDRWSRRKSVALMALVWSLATALTGVASGFAMLSAAFPQERRARQIGAGRLASRISARDCVGVIE
jgi:MFS family permease